MSCAITLDAFRYSNPVRVIFVLLLLVLWGEVNVLSKPDTLSVSRSLSPVGKEFPNTFETLVKKICRFLFHVLAHIYWAHFKETVALDLQGHLNTLYAHFIVFIRVFNLVDPKEICIMDDLSEVLCNPPPPSPTAQNHVTER